MSFATCISWLSGLAFVAPQLPPTTVFGTAIVLHTCDAVLCRLLARNNGHSPGTCTVLGFVAGIWAVAVLILLPRRHPARAG